ncbi:xanthine dehydrogenase family protein molybdopterin-binding subunit [Orrella sp. 11846]|uniref:xanthine dehydrogenase family protein molybdopterin-binding subunit n=1 Tax=Orrella sp. 11846 TaxID=3409913 RepID=UPI003B5C6E20
MLKKTVTEKKTFDVIGTRPVRPDGVPKVVGLAQYGADYILPGMLWGKILRSPHAHARILSIDTSRALALQGVKAVMTGADLPEQTFKYLGPERTQMNFWHMQRNTMAREKALFAGHPVAAVAAVSQKIAEQALELIDVQYEVLPHVIDVEKAMEPGAPLLFEDMRTRGVEPEPAAPSNVARRCEYTLGNVEDGFAQAHEVVEMKFKTAPVHQGYIEPHACLARYGSDGQCEIWSATQGHFAARTLTARLLGMSVSDLVIHPAEIGGGFGGKTIVYVEPVAAMLSKMSGHPVKMVMTREEVFNATGPTSGSAMTVRMGVTRDGKIVAAQAELKYQAGAFPGSPVLNASQCAFSMYDIQNVHVVGYDVVCNRPKVVAYRAPGSPIVAFAVESVVDELARKIGLDPLEIRLKNSISIGSPSLWGPHQHEGMRQTVEALMRHPDYHAPLGPNQGRGVASGFWFNGGGESAVSIQVGDDGSVTIASGSMDIGGSRASMAMMVAETLGIPYEKVRSTVASTAAVSYNHVTGGSRVTYATGMAMTQASELLIEDLRVRAAQLWNVSVDDVEWERGQARLVGAHEKQGETLSLARLAATRARTGGPIGVQWAINASGQAPGFSTQFCDVEVDPETGAVKILRYVAAQDVGRAIHPAYVEGQIHGGVTQGIGWALNEEYIYNDNGHLENAGFLDYRMPVASDLPMIEAVIVEVPNPNHPFGVKGAGEVNIVPVMGAIANAIRQATGVRMCQLPMSPPNLLEALDPEDED